VQISHGEFSVPKRAIKNIAIGGDVRAMSGKNALVPLMQSTSFQKLIIADLPEQGQKLAGVVLGNVHCWQGRLHAAWDAFVAMEYWWPQAVLAKSEIKSIAALEDADVWNETLHWHQCCAEFTPDTRKSDISTRFHTEWQLEIEGRSEENSRPDNDFVFGLWRLLMLGCSTVTITSHEHCQVCLPFVDI